MRMLYPQLVQRGIYKFLRLQSRITQKLLLPFGRDLYPERWVFVVGCYNSGTSLLAKILAEHPLIGGLPDEGIFYTDSLPYPEQFGWPRMWIRCLDNVRLNPDDVSREKILRIKKQWSLMFPKNTPILLEKSVVNVTRMPFLQAHFAPAYFVAIVRNGYAVAEGIRRRVRLRGGRNPDSYTYPIALCAEQWCTCDEIISQDSGKLDHFIQVSYEAFTADPVGVMNKITDFLELSPLDPEVVHRSWNIQEKYEPIQNMNSRSFERLSEADLDIIERVAGDCLAKYGYEPPRD